MDKKLAIREQVYDMMEQAAQTPTEAQEKDITLTQDVKAMLPAGSKRPIQILQIQNLTINTTVINCVNILRMLDGLEIDEPRRAAPVKAFKRGEKKERIIALLEQGEEMETIATKLGTSKSYVYQVNKEGQEK